jgi:hypothetical protein
LSQCGTSKLHVASALFDDPGDDASPSTTSRQNSLDGYYELDSVLSEDSHPSVPVVEGWKEQFRFLLFDALSSCSNPDLRFILDRILLIKIPDFSNFHKFKYFLSIELISKFPQIKSTTADAFHSILTGDSHLLLSTFRPSLTTWPDWRSACAGFWVDSQPVARAVVSRLGQEAVTQSRLDECLLWGAAAGLTPGQTLKWQRSVWRTGRQIELLSAPDWPGNPDRRREAYQYIEKGRWRVSAAFLIWIGEPESGILDAILRYGSDAQLCLVVSHSLGLPRDRLLSLLLSGSSAQSDPWLRNSLILLGGTVDETKHTTDDRRVWRDLLPCDSGPGLEEISILYDYRFSY